MTNDRNVKTDYSGRMMGSIRSFSKAVCILAELCGVIAVLGLLIALHLAGGGSTFASDFEYTSTGNTVTTTILQDCNCNTAGAFVSPAPIQHCPVMCFSTRAFVGHRNFRSVPVPHSVMSIDGRTCWMYRVLTPNFHSCPPTHTVVLGTPMPAYCDIPVRSASRPQAYFVVGTPMPAHSDMPIAHVEEPVQNESNLIQVQGDVLLIDAAKKEDTDTVGTLPEPSVSSAVVTLEPKPQQSAGDDKPAGQTSDTKPATETTAVIPPLQADVEPAENISDTKSETESFSSTENKINEFTPISELQKLADRGDPTACYELGRHYRKGTGGCEKDEDKGNKYYIKGSESDTPAGWHCKAVCYELGIGTEKDEQKAFDLYKKAAEQGLARGQRQVGFCYQGGIGTKKDVFQAFEWVQKAAEQGDVFAQNNMGWCYQEGWGTSKNERKALYWFQKAAEQGEKNAQSTLANCYLEGIGTPKDLKKAVYWYLKSAEQGFANAQNWLGVSYLHGEDGVPKDKDTAVQWFTKAADQGHTEAQSTLGAIYFQQYNFEEAKKYLEPAAMKKNAQAQYFLASGYLAKKYYRRANEGPMSNDESEEYAFILLVASMKQGHEDARKMLELHKHNGNLSRPLRGDMPIFSDNRELVDLLNR